MTGAKLCRTWKQDARIRGEPMKEEDYRKRRSAHQIVRGHNQDRLLSVAEHIAL